MKIEPPEIEDIIEYQIEALDESLLQAVHTQPQFKLKSVNFVDEEQDSNQEWPCNLCGCVFITRNLLKSHMKEHKGTRKGGLIRRMCQLCGLSFATNGWYHHVSISLKCSRCTIKKPHFRCFAPIHQTFVSSVISVAKAFELNTT